MMMKNSVRSRFNRASKSLISFVVILISYKYLYPTLFSSYDMPNEISGKDIMFVFMGMIFVALTVPFCEGFYSITFTVYVI
jgi:hypothetical protein